MTQDEAKLALRRAIEQNEDRWFQKFEALPGLWTNGESDMAWLMRRIDFPERLDGLRVLDVGTNDGFMAFEAERRGAAQVVAVDHPEAWGYGGAGARGPHRPGRFDLMRQALGSKVQGAPLDVESDDFSPARLGKYDLVLFLGVLYHLYSPILAFKRLANLVTQGGRIIVETLVDLKDIKKPAAAFYPASGESKVTWWGPNPAMVRGLLEANGFTSLIEIPQEPGAGRMAVHAMRDYE